MNNLDLFPDLLPNQRRRGRKPKLATAAIGTSAPPPSHLVDPLVAERTVFNAERTHRFTLFRHWGDIDDYACGISMNPSGAAEEDTDRTVEGMCRRAREHWGVGAYYQLNVMSIRGTYSKDLAKTEVVNLPDNDEWIRRIASKARIVVVSWGKPGQKSGRGALSVPFDSMATMEPVHAQWQHTPVTVCMVGNLSSPGGRPRFLRPRQKEDAQVTALDSQVSHSDWCRDIAGYILEAHREGAGGMLALGTAFRDLQAIGALVREKTTAPVLEHRPGLPLATLREQFLALAEQGHRPILLAAGGAWTGFDLHSSKEPNALTDLVMLNAPFGATTRTLAREVRMRSRGGFTTLVSQVTVLVRQGLGRLVRSPDTPANRRIHWLDAKIHHPATAGLLNPIKRVLAKYKQITVS